MAIPVARLSSPQPSNPPQFLSTPPNQPAAQPAGSQNIGPYVLKTTYAKRTTSSTPGTNDAFYVPIPRNTIAIMGYSITPTGASVKTFWTTGFQIFGLKGDLTDVIATGTSYAGFLATKSSFGCIPIDPTTQTIVASLFPNDASVTYQLTVYFLIGPPNTSISASGFQVEGRDEVTTIFANTSAINTAQTVNVPGTTQEGFAYQVLAAWFITSAGTATGTMTYFDGTTASGNIDNTAAVASYVFNTGAKGANGTTFTDSGALQFSIQFVIGTAGVGNTSTLYVVLRVYPTS